MSEREEPALSSSESASLERGYRRLLACYPPGWPSPRSSA